MNEKEKLIFQLIKRNPYLSQQEMAEQLGMSRPALANMISSLIKRGEILGRAYVLPEKIKSLQLVVPISIVNSLLSKMSSWGLPILLRLQNL